MIDILLVFIVLKWVGAVDWSWGTVFIPVWISIIEWIGVALYAWWLDRNL